MSISKLFQDTAMNALKTTSVVSLGDISYYVGSRIEWSLSQEFDTFGAILPAVVFGYKDQHMTKDGVLKTFADFARRDDVFHHGFTERSLLIMRSTEPSHPTPTLPAALTEHLSLTSSMLLFVSTTNEELPDGPYFLRGRSLHRAWRLYPDTNSAFTLSVIPVETGAKYEFQPLNAGALSGLDRVVAVPSRLYFERSPTKPLNGLRVTVKDVFKLSGVMQTVGSRSYTNTYGPQTETADVVRAMIDRGAVIIGKTKLGGFQGSEVPPEKCIDYFPPWNPRGDGYQGPSGSSSGAGSTVASYDWVDLGVGIDSSGSIRMPASSYGLWGLRATWSLFSMGNIMPSVPKFDALGLLARSAQTIINIVEACSVSAQQPLTPSSIIYPIDWFPMKDAGQQHMVELFLDILSKSTGLEVQKLSLESEWAQTGPEDLRGTKLEEYLDKSLFWPNYFDGYHSWDKFREDHHKKFGYKPYTSPIMTKRWAFADNITLEERNRGFAELEIYQKWIHDFILNPGGKQNVILLPLGRPGANYRDALPAPGTPGPFAGTAYDPDDLCTTGGLPQVIIPIGQNPYMSRVTDRTEYAPIVATLGGPKGTDVALLRMAEEAMKAAGWPVDVLTGSTPFKVGDNERHVASPEGDAKYTGEVSHTNGSNL